MGCGGYGEAPALQVLREELLAVGFTNLGICGDERHCPGKSDHCKGDAFDAGNGAVSREDRWATIDHLLHDGRAWYAIHEGRGRRAYHRGGDWFAASGHDGHFHLSIRHDLRDDTRPWLQGGTDMTPEEHGQLWETWQRAKNLESWAGALEKLVHTLIQRVDSVKAGGGAVDVDALADAVADRLAERLRD